jgi:nucleotide-binding universal stress UspA family protein
VSAGRIRPLISTVLHPTDCSEGSKAAFHHALKAALTARAKLTLLHVSSDGAATWAAFPAVRDTLERWDLLRPGSPRTAVADLGIDVRKKITRHGNPVGAVVNHMKQHPAELIVLGTQQRRGAVAWLGGSVAEPIARRTGEMTLFIADESRGFVSADDGSVSLRHILIPIAPTPDAQPALDAAARLATGLACDRGVFTMLHVGTAESMPAVHPPDVAGWEWRTEVRAGDVIHTIIDASKETRADLIVMTTDGRNGFLDGLRGSHSERVLRLAGVPLLTVPLGSLIYDYIALS